MKHVRVVSMILVFPVVFRAWATPPATTNVHGALTAPDGSPLTGARAYIVKFYDAQIAGTQLGGDLTGTTTLSSEGLFNIPITPPTDIFDAASIWYELAIDTDVPVDNNAADDVFADRVQVHSVPFAQQAAEAGHVDVENVGNGLLTSAEFDFLTGLTSNVQTQLDDHTTAIGLKADSADVYAKTETYSKTEVDGKLFTWETVSGVTKQMEPNHGYLLTGNDPCTLTLPPSTSLAICDTLRIATAGTSGFTIAQNENQFVLVETVQDTWMPRENSRNWLDVAVSGNVSVLIGAVYTGYLYLSKDSGQTWTPSMTDTARAWTCVASSQDGETLIAVSAGNYPYVSLDSGSNWQACTNAGSRDWASVAISADGTKTIASDTWYGVGGYLYTSTDSGTTWTPRMTDDVRRWRGVASSFDGTKLIACVFPGYLYTSTNSGEDWTERMTDELRSWHSLASSADGSKLIASDAGDGSGAYLYTSTDSGATWTVRMTDSPREWQGVSSSSDGTKLTAVARNGYIYASSDSGETWTAQMTDAIREWSCVASSSDGLASLAGGSDIQLYTHGIYTPGMSTTQTSPGPSSRLKSNYTQAVELLYAGNDQFMVTSHEGAKLTVE